MLSLIIPVYRNEGSIPSLLDAVAQLDRGVTDRVEAVFVVDGSPDRCYELLRDALPLQPFRSRLVLLSRNFGSFAAIRVGLELGSGSRFAVMAADLQEPPELVLEISKVLSRDEADVVIGVREGRADPLLARLPAQIFWGLYKRFVVPDMPAGGVDIFGCNRAFRDSLLKLDERYSSLVAQVFWLGFRRKQISYTRRARVHGKSAWTFHKKLSYLMDSVFAFSDLPIRLLIRAGGMGALLSASLAFIVLLAKLFGTITVPGYAATIFAITFLGSLNLLGLGVVGSYAWRAYENTKGRPIAIPMRIDAYHGSSHD